MRPVSQRDYREFIGARKSVLVEKTEVDLTDRWKSTSLAPPASYRPETTTIWSFPDRGDWATHSGNYRGNWSPYIPRNLILRYSQPGETVLDQMVGSGTTLVECKLLGRQGIGVDVNDEALMIAWNRTDFPFNPLDDDFKPSAVKLFGGDARNLDLIETDSIDLVATHPPYAGIIKYTGERSPDDLSSLKLDPYLAAMKQVASESLRVLKPGRHCAILIGDTRQHKHYVPISARVLQQFLDVGFILREDIIKLQHKMKATREKWRGSRYDFYLIAHEHLFVFRKPNSNEKLSSFRNSTRWWSDIVPQSTGKRRTPAKSRAPSRTPLPTRSSESSSLKLGT
jgi:DNA modification methylase